MVGAVLLGAGPPEVPVWAGPVAELPEVALLGVEPQGGWVGAQGAGLLGAEPQVGWVGAQGAGLRVLEVALPEAEPQAAAG